MIVTNAGWDAVDAAASGAQRNRRAGFAGERSAARRRTALKPYGKTVRSWHPLLMPRPITLDAISRETGMSINTIQRHFQQVQQKPFTGLTALRQHRSIAPAMASDDSSAKSQ